MMISIGLIKKNTKYHEREIYQSNYIFLFYYHYIVHSDRVMDTYL